MTNPRDDHSAHGAWFTSCRLLGWEVVAEALETPVKTLQNWANETKTKGPPGWAIEKVDVLLKEFGKQPLNSKALAVRIGERPGDMLSMLAEIEQELEVAARVIARTPAPRLSQLVDLLALTSEIRRHLLAIDSHVCLNLKRDHAGDRREVPGDPADPNKERPSPPRLRAVPSG